jgi:hypothetical protein
MPTASRQIAEKSSRSGDFPYFRSLWNTVVVSLLAAAFLPLLVLGGVVYVYTHHSPEKRGGERLAGPGGRSP